MHFIETLFDLKTGDLSKVIFALLTNLVLAIVIAVVGFWLTGVLTRLVNRILRKSETDPGLISFLTSFLSMALKIMVAISAITQLGVEMTSFLTLLGAAGIAVGMAFSGTLSNFAGGINEVGRVLKPGGRMLWSVPFRADLEKNLIRAEISEDGSIVHHHTPEYHGDPVNTNGCLCFTHFGWEMLNQVREAGFRDAYALAYWSDIFGYLGREQLIFVAVK
jgi:hypothetical protein